MERSFYLVAYDVVDDKRRAKTAKYLESIGDRVQGSVFEIYLTKAEVDKLLKKAAKLLKKEEDSLRIYLLCESCRGKVINLGPKVTTPPPGVVIV
jgi:CRISPR-associated protein Cas2